MSLEKTRKVGSSEYSWCKAVPGGTGITVLAILLSTQPNISLLQNTLHKLQNTYPTLRSKLHFDATTNNFSFITPPPQQHSPPSSLHIQQFDQDATSSILKTLTTTTSNLSPHQLLLEHEINRNDWADVTVTVTDLFYVSVYTISETQWTVALRLHTGACDRVGAVSLLRELLELMACGGGGDGDDDVELEKGNVEEGILGIESLVPNGKGSKWFWSRGIDMIGYSLNSFRLSQMEFIDAESPRRSQIVRLRMDRTQTQSLLDETKLPLPFNLNKGSFFTLMDSCGACQMGCKSRGIELCGALAAAGLIAAHASKNADGNYYQSEKYAVVTLVDCRSELDPVLSSHHLGFYHSAVLNTHDISGDDTLWDTAKRCYMAFSNAKNNNKHFTDMSDLNFLMCKAIENPGLTPSSSMRTAFISVFEDAVIEESNEMQKQLGVDDYIGCASVHGVGPTIAIFDTIRDGQLDCACAYPSPLHSREQMQNLIDAMVKILADSCFNGDSDKTVE
ncbi:hypothetical protein ACFE04_000735 [Oxalis oulophora]